MRFAGRRLHDEVEKAKLQHLPISCIMFDMDHFKTVNDQADHLFGSQVLREVGQLLLAQLRTTDVAARYGGDEFFGPAAQHTSQRSVRDRGKNPQTHRSLHIQSRAVCRANHRELWRGRHRGRKPGQ